MGLLDNPVTYTILANVLLWGVPLSIIQIQSVETDRDERVAELAKARLNPFTDVPISLDPYAQPSPLAQSLKFDSTAGPTPVSRATPSTELPEVYDPGESINVVEIPEMLPDLLTLLTRADGLGGPITLSSSKEALVPIAVRVERLQQERSNDALAALPLHWRDTLRQELGPKVKVSQANTVRLPVRELPERQEVPVIINDKGVAEGLVEPRHQLTRKAVEVWAARQQPAETGTVQVILVAAEPLPPAQK